MKKSQFVFFNIALVFIIILLAYFTIYIGAQLVRIDNMVEVVENSGTRAEFYKSVTFSEAINVIIPTPMFLFFICGLFFIVYIWFIAFELYKKKTRTIET